MTLLVTARHTKLMSHSSRLLTHLANKPTHKPNLMIPLADLEECAQGLLVQKNELQFASRSLHRELFGRSMLSLFVIKPYQTVGESE